MAAGGGTPLVRAVAIEDIVVIDLVGAQRAAHFDNPGALVGVRDLDLSTRRAGCLWVSGRHGVVVDRVPLCTQRRCWERHDPRISAAAMSKANVALVVAGARRLGRATARASMVAA